MKHTHPTFARVAARSTQTSNSFIDGTLKAQMAETARPYWRLHFIYRSKLLSSTTKKVTLNPENPQHQRQRHRDQNGGRNRQINFAAFVGETQITRQAP
jgi:hypothetical protein